MFQAREVHRENGHYRLLVEVTAGPNAGKKLRVAYDSRSHALAHDPEPADKVLIGVSGESYAELLAAVERAVEPSS